MVAYVYELSAAELAQVEGGSSFQFASGELLLLIRLRRVLD
jgi:hypothetical protein